MTKQIHTVLVKGLLVAAWFLLCPLAEAAEGGYKKYLNHCHQLMSTLPDLPVAQPFLFEVTKDGRTSYVIGTKGSGDTLDFVPDSVLKVVQNSNIFLYDSSITAVNLMQRNIQMSQKLLGENSRIHFSQQLSPPARAAYMKVKDRLLAVNSLGGVLLDESYPTSPAVVIGFLASLPMEEALNRAPESFQVKMAEKRAKLLEAGLDIIESLPDGMMQDTIDDLLQTLDSAEDLAKVESFAPLLPDFRDPHALLIAEAAKYKLQLQPLDSAVEIDALFDTILSIEAAEDALMHFDDAPKVDLTWMDLANIDFDVLRELQDFIAKQTPFISAQHEARIGRWIKTFGNLHASGGKVVIAADKSTVAAPWGVIEQLKKAGYDIKLMTE